MKGANVSVSKITISLPEGLVADIDRLASERGETRSAIVKEAAAGYVSNAHAADVARRRADGVQSALDAFEAMRSAPARTSQTTLELLRELRAGGAGGETIADDADARDEAAADE
jgi:predicted transcriptional regulator